MARNSIRHTLKAEIVNRLAAAPELSGVQVEYGDPGDTTEQDTVWFGHAPGNGYSIPLMQAGRKQREDLFDLFIFISRANHGESAQVSEAAAAPYFFAVENLFAEDETVGKFDGLVKAEITTYDGPHSWVAPNGAITQYAVTVSCEARYQ
jgi:hypothetical protein